jgi:hypothetical protein
MNTATVEVWVVVDENGDSAIGADQTAALAAYDENIGRDDDTPVGLRFAKVTVAVPLPTTFELEVKAAEDEPQATAAA